MNIASGLILWMVIVVYCYIYDVIHSISWYVGTCIAQNFG